MNFKNTLLPVQSSLQSKGRLLFLDNPLVMGILNATPDSFFDKGRESTVDALLKKAEQMLSEGAMLLDVGGASTKPGAEIIDVEEELKRVIPVVESIHKNFPEAWISVDTYHAKTAKESVIAGASMVNDVSSGRFDKDMLATVTELGVPYIAMHMQGSPETMQIAPQYNDVMYEVRDYLRNVCDECEAAGIKDIIVDAGFGFGKTVEQNFQLLKGLHSLRMLGKPILAGISRKSMICKTLKVSPENALNGTTALHMISLQQGANILRVHDVMEAVEVIKLHQAMMN